MSYLAAAKRALSARQNRPRQESEESEETPQPSKGLSSHTSLSFPGAPKQRSLSAAERAAILRSQPRPASLPTGAVQLHPSIGGAPIIDPVACWSCAEPLDPAARGRVCSPCRQAYELASIQPVLLVAPLDADPVLEEMPTPGVYR